MILNDNLETTKKHKCSTAYLSRATIGHASHMIRASTSWSSNQQRRITEGHVTRCKTATRPRQCDQSEAGSLMTCLWRTKYEGVHVPTNKTGWDNHHGPILLTIGIIGVHVYARNGPTPDWSIDAPTEAEQTTWTNFNAQHRWPARKNRKNSALLSRLLVFWSERVDIGLF